MVLMSEEELRDLVEDARRGAREAENRLVRRYARFVERRLARLKRARNWFWLTELEDARRDRSEVPLVSTGLPSFMR